MSESLYISAINFCIANLGYFRLEAFFMPLIHLHQQYNYPIISFKSGLGAIEQLLYKDKVICIDSNTSKYTLKHDYKTVDDYISKYPRAVGKCSLFINWPPNDPDDYLAIKKLKPILILIVYDTNVSKYKGKKFTHTGSIQLLTWLHEQSDYHTVDSYSETRSRHIHWEDGKDEEHIVCYNFTYTLLIDKDYEFEYNQSFNKKKNNAFIKLMTAYLKENDIKFEKKKCTSNATLIEKPRRNPFV